MGSSEFAVLAESLSKRYGNVHALAGVDLAVREGMVCGLLGPNGAGKTTIVRVLSTLLRADGGRATVAGFDVTRQSAQVRYRIGLAGQRPTIDETLTGRENLEMWARLYHFPARSARRRADELLEQFSLAEAGGRRARFYSGGMRRRLDLAAAFILAPQVLFLDEPTTGLDPRNRNDVWKAVRTLTERGTTVLLTTQYLDEADQLAQQIVVIDNGRVIADDTPERLKSAIGGDRIDLVVRDAEQLPAAAAVLSRVTGTEATTDPYTRQVSAAVRNRIDALIEALRELTQAEIVLEDIALRRPTLDEVFLRLTRQQRAQKEAAV
ncbi:ATP-binding cassette domain-containing protein [Streptomyces sp. NPDC020801]|uniref:ATP-binding cassette domain-containing protein n=1 Tax=unclassified Streptomyces TaxID=2593676 RepID=UPI0037B9FA1A